MLLRLWRGGETAGVRALVTAVPPVSVAAPDGLDEVEHGAEPVLPLIAKGDIAVTDPQVAASLRFQGLTARDVGVVAHWRGAIEPRLDHLVDVFYQHVQADRKSTRLNSSH